MPRRLFAATRAALRRYFVAGILFVAPLAITAWVIVAIVRTLDSLVLPRVLKLFAPGDYAPPTIPVLGALFTLLLIVLMGFVARHVLGAEAIRWWERVLGRVPVARRIYGAVKQLFEAVFSMGAEKHFNRVVAIEFPRKGLYSLGFTTGRAHGILPGAESDTLVCCFVPKTPNPTTGFFLLVPPSEIHAVDLTVEEAFKLVMSGGLVMTEIRKGQTEPDLAPAPGAAAPQALSGGRPS